MFPYIHKQSVSPSRRVHGIGTLWSTQDECLGCFEGNRNTFGIWSSCRRFCGKERQKHVVLEQNQRFASQIFHFNSFQLQFVILTWYCDHDMWSRHRMALSYACNCMHMSHGVYYISDLICIDLSVIWYLLPCFTFLCWNTWSFRYRMRVGMAGGPDLMLLMLRACCSKPEKMGRFHVPTRQNLVPCIPYTLYISHTITLFYVVWVCSKLLSRDQFCGMQASCHFHWLHSKLLYLRGGFDVLYMSWLVPAWSVS